MSQVTTSQSILYSIVTFDIQYHVTPSRTVSGWCMIVNMAHHHALLLTVTVDTTVYYCRRRRQKTEEAITKNKSVAIEYA